MEIPNVLFYLVKADLNKSNFSFFTDIRFGGACI